MGADGETVFLGAKTLAELLHLVAALNGRFRGIEVAVAAAGGDSDSDFLPLAGLQLTSFESVPFLLVSLDKIDGLLVRPWNRLDFLSGCDGGDGFGRGEWCRRRSGHLIRRLRGWNLVRI